MFLADGRDNEWNESQRRRRDQSLGLVVLLLVHLALSIIGDEQIQELDRTGSHSSIDQFETDESHFNTKQFQQLGVRSEFLSRIEIRTCHLRFSPLLSLPSIFDRPIDRKFCFIIEA